MDTQPTQHTIQVEPAALQKEYHTPVLREYGTVQELTKNIGEDGEIVDFQTIPYSTYQY